MLRHSRKQRHKEFLKHTEKSSVENKNYKGSLYSKKEFSESDLSAHLAFDSEAYLANFSDMENLAYETIASFLSILPTLIFQVDSAIQSQNPASLEISAHTLKGNLSNLYARPSELLAGQLEQMGHNKIMDPANRTFQELKNELSKLSNALKEFVLARKIV